ENIIGFAYLAHNVTLRLQRQREQQQQLQQAVSESRHSQDLVQESELRYQALIQATHCVVWQADAQGFFTHLQKSWENYTGQPWNEHQAQGWLNAVHPEDRNNLLIAWQKAREQRGIFDIAIRLRSQKHQDYRYVLMRASPFFNIEGQLQE